MSKRGRWRLAALSAIPGTISAVSAALAQLVPDLAPPVGVPLHALFIATTFGGLLMTALMPGTPPTRKTQFIDGDVEDGALVAGNTSDADTFIFGGVRREARIVGNTHNPRRDER